MPEFIALFLDPEVLERTGYVVLAVLAAAGFLALAAGVRLVPGMRLRAKLSFALLLVSLAPFLLLALFNLRATYTAQLISTRHALFGAASQTAAGVDVFLASTLDAVRTESLLPEFSRLLLLPPEERPRSPEQAAAIGVLSTLKRRDEVFISSYALLDNTALVVADTTVTNMGQTKADREYFQLAVQAGLPRASQVVTHPHTGEPSLYFSSPVRGPDGRIVGVLRARYRATILQRIIFNQNDRVGPGSFAVLLDENLSCLADGSRPGLSHAHLLIPDQDDARPPQLSLPETTRSKGLLFAATLQGPEGPATVNALSPLSGKPWSVLYALPANQFLSGVVPQLLYAILFLALLAVIAVAASFFVSSRIAGPMARLAQATRQVMDGDLTVRAPVESPDEIGMLAGDFNRMTGQLQRRVEFEHLLAEISRIFATATSRGLARAVESALEGILRFTDADRAYLLLCPAPEGDPLFHEQLRQDISPRQTPVCSQPKSACPWFWDRVHTLDDVMVPSLEQLPLEAAMERELWAREGVVSLLCVPLAPGGRLTGVLGCETVRGPRVWDERDLGLMHMAAEIVASTVERLRSEDAALHAREDLERKVQERTRELVEANEQLRELDALKSAFLSSASHELRTPLTSVLGFAKLAARSFARHFQPLAGADPALADKARVILENLAIIGKEGDRLTRLVNDLLDLNKIESGRMEWRDQELDPEEVLSTAFDAARGRFLDKAEVAFRLELVPDLPRLFADRDRIQQVVLNLLDNAGKFTSQGLVELRADVFPGGGIQVSVQDSGPGVPPEDRERIFEKFCQVYAPVPDSNKPRGTGLGLTICRQIVEHYGGRIWTEPAPNRGSIFAFTLPPAALRGSLP